jgi:hypothetical protein
VIVQTIAVSMVNVARNITQDVAMQTMIERPLSTSRLDVDDAFIFLGVPPPHPKQARILRRDERHETLGQHRPSVIAARTQSTIPVGPSARLFLSRFLSRYAAASG